jgi:hypothetical protein
VTITGTNFDPTPANNEVSFNGSNATVTAATTTSLTVIVPSGATNGQVNVVTGGHDATSTNVFKTGILPDFSATNVSCYNSVMALNRFTSTQAGNCCTAYANSIVAGNTVDVANKACSAAQNSGGSGGNGTTFVNVTPNSTSPVYGTSANYVPPPPTTTIQAAPTCSNLNFEGTWDVFPQFADLNEWIFYPLTCDATLRSTNPAIPCVEYYKWAIKHNGTTNDTLLLTYVSAGSILVKDPYTFCRTTNIGYESSYTIQNSILTLGQTDGVLSKWYKK